MGCLTKGDKSITDTLARKLFPSHDKSRDKKLLLNKKEIERISKKVIDKGITIIPLGIFISNNKLKMKIAVAKGKKDYDKRNSIKERDLKRELQRSL